MAMISFVHSPINHEESPVDEGHAISNGVSKSSVTTPWGEIAKSEESLGGISLTLTDAYVMLVDH
ncbi:hypothetical protein TIFTF001_004737 [Ficus carica]|uniref:Uncharacterized protein n=1 Tax=Ficus carica TaxID=3494 RepID=A0AA87ZJJ6_FICCA|nr:hypothetical protein TIFTF001_004737 [Ficus carica]